MSAVSFLHQAYEHETVVPLCGFSAISAAQSPLSDAATSTGITRALSSDHRRFQWFYWVDKRRGLLGCTSTPCPSPADPPAGRRQAQSTGDLRQSSVARRSSHCPSSGQDSPSNAAHCVHRSNAPRSKSLPVVLSPLLVGADAHAADAGELRKDYSELSLCGDDGQQVLARELHVMPPTLAGKPDVRPGSMPHLRSSDGHLNITLPANNDPLHNEAVATGGRKNCAVDEPPSFGSTYSTENVEKKIAGCTNVLLRGLDSPTRVAAFCGKNKKSRGVLFVHSVTPPPRCLSLNVASDAATARGICAKRLSFFAVGAQRELTLCERLCNPIAICVTRNRDVLVLDEVSRQEPIRDPGHEPVEQENDQQKKQFKVRSLHHVKLTSFLESQTMANNSAWKGGIKMKTHAPSQNGGRSTSEGDDESDTDWEENVSTSSGGFSPTTNTEVNPIKRNGRCRGRHKAPALQDILEFPLPPRGEPTEEPVGMCVLADDTIVIAASRLAPRHGGSAIAESRGVVRVFPSSQTSRDRFHEATATNIVVGDPTKNEKCTDDNCNQERSTAYDPGKQWLLAEGLPVITGIVASDAKSGGIYVSLCGSSRDGTVVAIGALSTRRCSRGNNAIGGAAVGKPTGTRQPKSALSTDANFRSRSNGGEEGTGDNVFVPIVSGHAAILTVDRDNNLFYVTAHSKGICNALWCRRAGASRRRRSSLFSNALVLRLQRDFNASKVAPETPHPATHASSSDRTEPTTGAPCSQSQSPTAMMVRAAAAAELATQALALSNALIDEDYAFPSERRRGTPLFAVTPTPKDQMARWAAAWGYGGQPVEAVRGNGLSAEPVSVNVAVVARCRPLLAREVKCGVRAAVFCRGDEIVVSGNELPIKRSRKFRFDRVFGPMTSQARIYTETVAPVVRKMLDGYNCSVLTYGQTGSGKTFTMQGGLDVFHDPCKNETPPIDARERVETLGIVPRAVHTIFREGDAGGGRRYWVYVSHMEIYNERLFDLLAPDGESGTGNEFRRQQPRGRSPRNERSPGRSPPHSPECSPPQSPIRSSVRSANRSSSPRPRATFSACGRSTVNLSFKEQSVSPRRRDGSVGRNGNEKPHPSSEAPRSGSRTLDTNNRGTTGVDAGTFMGKGLTIEEDPKLGVMVKGLTQVEVKSPEEIFAIVTRSTSNRRTAETMCNLESSRSHSVFCVRVISAEPTPWGGEVTRDGRLSLVDLSGSENIKRSGAMGTRAKEAAAIGQSLLALGRVMKALVQRAPHVPYRESKLTRVLADSLGGNAVTAIILNITPNHGMLDETLSTLAYAKIAQAVENTPNQRIANVSKSPSDDSCDKGDPVEYSTQKELARTEGMARTRKQSTTSRGAGAVYVCPWEGKVPIISPTLSVHCPVHLKRSSPRPSVGATDISSRVYGVVAAATIPRKNEVGLASVLPRSSDATLGPRPASAGRTNAEGPHFARNGISSPTHASPVVDAHGVKKHDVANYDGGKVGQGENYPATAGFASAGIGRRMTHSASGKGRTSEHAINCNRGGQDSYPGCDKKYGNTKNLAETAKHDWGILIRSDASGNLVARRGGVEGTRVFDSVAAEWVFATVLTRQNNTKNLGSNDNHDQRGGIERVRGKPRAGRSERCKDGVCQNTTQSTAREDPGLLSNDTLRPAAKAALLEIFSRYARTERDFLVPHEVADLLRVWCDPPVDPTFGVPCQTDHSSKGNRQVGTTGVRRTRHRREYNEDVDGREFSDESGNVINIHKNSGANGRRVLSKEAFLKFCEEAAARDPIFIRHLFRCCDYDSHLTLLSQRATRGRRVSGSGQERVLEPVGQMREKGRLERALDTIVRDTTRRGRSITKGVRVGRPHTAAAGYHRPSDKTHLFIWGNEVDCRSSTTGGIVDPADFWDRMEIRGNMGDKYRRDGVLSRGGGAHFSGPLPSGNHVSGDPVSKQRHTSESESNEGEERVGCPIEDAGVVRPEEGENYGAHILPVSDSCVSENQVHRASSDLDPRETCGWCGCEILSATAVHTPAFCDQDLLV